MPEGRGAVARKRYGTPGADRRGVELTGLGLDAVLQNPGAPKTQEFSGTFLEESLFFFAHTDYYTLVSERMEQAQELMLWGKYLDARDIFEELLSQDKDNPDIHYHLGLCALGAEDWKLALMHFHTCLTINPEWIDAALDMGDALMALERMDEAASCYRSALAKSPDNARVLMSMARYHDVAEEFSEAVTFYEKALSLGDPWESPRFELALAYMKVQRYLEADILLEGIITENLRRGSQAFVGDWAPGSREDLARSIGEMREERLEAARMFRAEKGYELEQARLMFKSYSLLSTMDALQMTEIFREIKTLQHLGIDMTHPSSHFRLNSLGGNFSGQHLACLVFAIEQEMKFDGMLDPQMQRAWLEVRPLFP